MDAEGSGFAESFAGEVSVGLRQESATGVGCPYIQWLLLVYCGSKCLTCYSTATAGHFLEPQPSVAAGRPAM